MAKQKETKEAAKPNPPKATAVAILARVRGCGLAEAASALGRLNLTDEQLQAAATSGANAVLALLDDAADKTPEPDPSPEEPTPAS